MSTPGKPPPPEAGTSFAVICHTCHVNVWRGNELVEQDGQVLLTAFADSAPGSACPSRIADCPHKATQLAEKAKRRNATQADLDALQARLTALEARAPKP